MPSGMTIRECTVCEQDGARWVGLPAKAVIDANGRQALDHKGKRAFVAVIQIHDRNTRDAFQRKALAAIDELRLGR